MCAVGIVQYAFYGWAVSLVWGWFVVPLFGLPKLTLLWAIGMIQLSAMVIPHKTPEEEPTMELLIKYFSKSMVGLAVPLSVAWVVHFFA